MGQSRCREAAGFTMLEALVAIVVLAFGVLAVANLLIKSFRFAQQSSYDVVALQLANDISDRMRANGAQIIAGTFDNFDTKQGVPQIADGTNLFKTPCTGSTATCGPISAVFDLAEWSHRVITSLPSGRAVICRDSNTWTQGTGYTWDCKAVPGGTGSQKDTPLVVKIGWLSRFNDDSDTGTADGNLADGSAKVQLVVVVSPGVDK
ncbi:type IV pilus modification protein PilV [Cupriavidus pauculus]|uniref:type IV pilus modification protein PilV n=1 Tax=Cupriavidus pauculus TaxID=82633 RepID=UPI001EE255D0|nr:type IV pilus modification protein PilV [Cupriavidus pauculus]GJG96622.1 type IV pilus modification protein PilV [Cupriavidus pauculus]